MEGKLLLQRICLQLSGSLVLFQHQWTAQVLPLTVRAMTHHVGCLLPLKCILNKTLEFQVHVCNCSSKLKTILSEVSQNDIKMSILIPSVMKESTIVAYRLCVSLFAWCVMTHHQISLIIQIHIWLCGCFLLCSIH